MSVPLFGQAGWRWDRDSTCRLKKCCCRLVIFVSTATTVITAIFPVPEGDEGDEGDEGESSSSPDEEESDEEVEEAAKEKEKLKLQRSRKAVPNPKLCASLIKTNVRLNSAANNYWARLISLQETSSTSENSSSSAVQRWRGEGWRRWHRWEQN